MLYTYYITTSEGETYISTQTEYSFSDTNWLGSSNLYVQSGNYSWRPYVIAGTDTMYFPRIDYNDSARYVTITDVRVDSVRSFDTLPSLIIVFLVVLIFISLRSLLRRR